MAARVPRPVLTWTVYVGLLLSYLADAFTTIASRFSTLYNGRQWLRYNNNLLEEPWLTTVPGTLTAWHFADYVFHGVRLVSFAVLLVMVSRVVTKNWKLIYPSQTLPMVMFGLVLICQVAITLVVSYSDTPWGSSVWLFATQAFLAGAVFLVYILFHPKQPSKMMAPTDEPEIKEIRAISKEQTVAVWLWFPWILYTLSDASIRSVVEYKNLTDAAHIQKVVTPLLLVFTFLGSMLFFVLWKHVTVGVGSLYTAQYRFAGGMDFYAMTLSLFLYITGVGIYVSDSIDSTTIIILCALCVFLLIFSLCWSDTTTKDTTDQDRELEEIVKTRRRVL